MEMTEILQPAISYAKDGFPVSELIAFYMIALIVSIPLIRQRIH